MIDGRISLKDVGVRDSLTAELYGHAPSLMPPFLLWREKERRRKETESFCVLSQGSLPP